MSPREYKAVVLIVEDDALVRMDTAEMVEDAGYHALEASNADEAIRLLETRNDIDVVFTDVEMPGSMDGIRLAHAVSRRWPPVKLIAASGRPQFTVDDLPKGGRFLSKPYRPHEVRRTLDELLAA